MSKWILLLTLLAMPVFAQRARVDNLKAFRQDLAAAVSNGSLTAEEKQKYEAALKSIEEQRQARKSGAAQADRKATRQAMQDLLAIASSTNLKEDDRAKLAKHIENAKTKGKGKRNKQ
jgi:septal ring factor EnvC (AmiA/AmiB activator)